MLDMAGVGDRVLIAARKVGEASREGVVIAVSGALLTVRWSTSEESTFIPSMGSLTVIGAKTRGGAAAGKRAAPAKAPASKSASKKTPGAKSPAKSGGAGKSATGAGKSAAGTGKAPTPAKPVGATTKTKKATKTKSSGSAAKKRA